MNKSAITRLTMCPKCSSTLTRCADSRIHVGTGGRRRRYYCDTCSHRWTTLELPIELIEDLHKVQPMINELANNLVALRELLHHLPIEGMDVPKLMTELANRTSN
jgi:hypothetical protein